MVFDPSSKTMFPEAPPVPPERICRYIGKPCTQAACAQWVTSHTSIQVGKAVKKTSASMCIDSALMQAIAALTVTVSSMAGGVPGGLIVPGMGGLNLGGGLDGFPQPQ